MHLEYLSKKIKKKSLSLHANGPASCAMHSDYSATTVNLNAQKLATGKNPYTSLGAHYSSLYKTSLHQGVLRSVHPKLLNIFVPFLECKISGMQWVGCLCFVLSCMLLWTGHSPFFLFLLKLKPCIGWPASPASLAPAYSAVNANVAWLVALTCNPSRDDTKSGI